MSIGYGAPAGAPLTSPAFTGTPTINGVPARGYTRGSAVFSGTGVQTAFVIPHGLGVVPAAVTVTANSIVAAALMLVMADSVNVTVTFLVAPASGAGNVSLYWTAFA
jgi:hypothetical protein